MRISSFLCLTLFALLSHSQILTLEEFYGAVKEYHPVAKQANLIRERGDLALREGRGFFDPKLVSKYSTKDYKEKDYYDLWNTYLEIPTVLNFDVKAGFERNSGVFLNPENNLPVGGLYYAGISVPLGQGFFMDNRLYQRKSGQLNQQKMQAEAVTVLNNLFLDATVTYWRWYESYQRVLLFDSALNLTNLRFEGIKESVQNGESAAIDSVESKIQVQAFSNELLKAQLQFDNNWLLMQNMLWDAQYDEGVYLPDSTLNILNETLGQFEDFAMRYHPELRQLDVKNEQLKLDKRLYAEQIKPQLDVNYNFLLDAQGDNAGQFQSNNYKAGVEFSIPILLRKERAKLSAAKVKISENEFKIDQKTRQVLNKVRASYNQIITTGAMIDQQLDAVDNYVRMVDGEYAKFENGESSIFLINSRENKAVDAYLKLVDLETTYQIYIGTLYWASGYFPEWLQSDVAFDSLD